MTNELVIKDRNKTQPFEIVFVGTNKIYILNEGGAGSIMVQTNISGGPWTTVYPKPIMTHGEMLGLAVLILLLVTIFCEAFGTRRNK